MRAFLAIELSRDVRERIAALQEELKPRVPSARWVRPENLHLTLRFLGETDPSTVDALVQTLSRRVVQLPAFRLDVAGCGCFPSAKRPRVIWVGVAPVPPELMEIQEATEHAVQAAGLEREERPFAPHLTIGRFKRPDPALAEVVPGLARREFGTVAVSELVLFESKLSPRGARYEVIARFPL